MPSYWAKVSTLPSNQFAEALQWILQHNYGLQWLIHHLDDYLIVGAPDSHSCGEHLQCFLRVCMLLGFPIAMDKVDSPATVLPFLGLELDSVLQQIHLPPDKLKENPTRANQMAIMQ